MPRKPDLTKKERYNDPFPSRLRELQEERHVTQEQLKVVLNLANRQSVTGYIDGETLPTIDKLVAVANYFGVTPNYLLGFSDAATNDIEMQEICDYTGLSVEAINAICKMLNLRFDWSTMPIHEAINGIIESNYLRNFGTGIMRIDTALVDVENALEIAKDKEFSPPIKKLEALLAARTKLELAIFNFTEEARRLADAFGAYDGLKAIDSEYDRVVEETSDNVREEAADDGQHIETSDD